MTLEDFLFYQNRLESMVIAPAHEIVIFREVR